MDCLDRRERVYGIINEAGSQGYKPGEFYDRLRRSDINERDGRNELLELLDEHRVKITNDRRVVFYNSN